MIVRFTKCGCGKVVKHIFSRRNPWKNFPGMSYRTIKHKLDKDEECPCGGAYVSGMIMKRRRKG